MLRQEQNAYNPFDEDHAGDLLFAQQTTHAVAPKAQSFISKTQIGLAILCIAGISSILFYQKNSQAGATLAPLSQISENTHPVALWQTLERPKQLYSFAHKELGWWAPIITSRMNEAGLEEDSFTLETGNRTTHMYISIERSLSDLVERSFFVTIVLKAAEQSLSVNSLSQPETLDLSYGSVEIAPAVLEGKERNTCHAFRFLSYERSLSFKGWYCSVQDDIQARQQIACTLESLSLVKTPENDRFSTLFEANKTVGQKCRNIMSAKK